jgi:DNA-binding MarR family transcriptional regulator
MSSLPGPSLPYLGDVLELLRLLWAIDHLLEKTSKDMESNLGVTGPQRLVLRLLGRFPGITAGRLSKLMLVHASTVSIILKRLEERGLIERREDTRDRRRAFLGLTRAGRDLNADLPGTVEAAVKHLLATMPEEKVQHAHDVLSALGRALEAQHRAAAAPSPAAQRSRRKSRKA